MFRNFCFLASTIQAEATKRANGNHFPEEVHFLTLISLVQICSAASKESQIICALFGLEQRIPDYPRLSVPCTKTRGLARKKLDLRGASRPPSILIRPSNAGREIPRTPALSDLESGAISWNRYPGRDHYPLGRETVTPGRARLTTQPKLSEAQRWGFFSHRRRNSPRWGFEPPTCGVPPVASHHSG